MLPSCEFKVTYTLIELININSLSLLLKQVKWIIRRITRSAAWRAVFSRVSTVLQLQVPPLIPGWGIRWNCKFEALSKAYKARSVCTILFRPLCSITKDPFFLEGDRSHAQGWTGVNSPQTSANNWERRDERAIPWEASQSCGLGSPSQIDWADESMYHLSFDTYSLLYCTYIEQAVDLFNPSL